MKTQYLVLSLCILLVLFVPLSLAVEASFEDYEEPFPMPRMGDVVYTYSRFADIEKKCSHFLSSAHELKPDDSRGYRIKNELFFNNGDWEEESGGSPLMPFDDSDVSRDISSPNPPLKTLSFSVIDVSPVHLSKTTVSVSGQLSIGISRNGSLMGSSSKFYTRPGVSVLELVFEGVYMETNENGGERLLCMLGTASLPNWKWFDHRLDVAKKYGSSRNQIPRLLRDDQILLVLRYPHTFNLTQRAVRGEMTSLNDRGSVKYFDRVYVSSQLGYYSKYQFSPEVLESVTCDPHPYLDEMVEDGAQKFSSSEFCQILRGLSTRAFDAKPNYRFNGEYLQHRRIGPFLLGKEITAAHWSSDNVRLMFEDVKCEQETISSDKTSIARVSAVIRAICASRVQDNMEARTGLSGTTLSAEGTYDSSSGQLCMVGCLGMVGSGLNGCDSQISVYFPRAFSISQRSTISGSISSIKNGSDLFFPVLFDAVMSSTDLICSNKFYSTSYLSYKYSKIDQASEFKRSQPYFKVLYRIKQSLLRYPALEEGNGPTQLDLLSKDLDLGAYAIPDSSFDGKISRIYVRLEVVSLGPLFRHHQPQSLKYGSKNHLLNVSMHLMFFTEAPSYQNVSRLFLEGLYDPLVGEAHLIGCRKVVSGNKATERGLDCLIEVKVQYPSETTRWIKSSATQIIITTQRTEADPLYFAPISLQILMIQSRNHERDAAFRKTFEGVLRNLILLVAIAIILGQLFYMEEKKDATPYVSLVMLAIQIIGYSLPLISGCEVLLKSKDSKSYQLLLTEVLDCSSRLFVLSAFLLNLRLFQKVYESRKKPSRGSPFKCAPSEKRVLFLTLVVHTFGFLAVFVSHAMLLRTENGRIQAELEEYADLIRVLFLLPQVIGNFLWKNHSRPLRKVYYIGFTLVNLVLHAYDCIRDRPEMSHFTSFGNIAVPLTMIALAIAVHLQHNPNYAKFVQFLVSRKFKFLSPKSGSNGKFQSKVI